MQQYLIYILMIVIVIMEMEMVRKEISNKHLWMEVFGFWRNKKLVRSFRLLN